MIESFDSPWRMAGEVDRGKLGIGDVDLGVVVFVEAGVDLEPCWSSCERSG